MLISEYFGCHFKSKESFLKRKFHVQLLTNQGLPSSTWLFDGLFRTSDTPHDPETSTKCETLTLSSVVNLFYDCLIPEE